MPPVVDQEFVAHLFAFEDGPRADLAYAQLHGLWAACRDQLGMSVPIAGLDVPDRLPAERRELPSGAMLAAQQRAGVPDRQCVLRRVGGGVLNLSVMMVQPQPERTGLRPGRPNGDRLGWADFALLWSRASANGTDALLGAVVLLARTQSKRNPSAKATAQLGRSLAGLLPYDESRDAEWWRDGVTTPTGLGVWDTRRGHPDGARELVVVAAPTADQELSRWVWLDPHAPLPPLAEYLLEAAIVGYHGRVLDGWNSAPRLTDLDGLVAEVAATFDGSFSSETRPELLRSHLKRLQLNEVHLATLNERLERIVDQTGAALRRMATAWGEPGTMLPNDRSAASALIDDASAELAHQRSRLTRTTRTRQIVADELARTPRAADASITTASTAVASRAVTGPDRSPTRPPEDPSRKVFVVHGRDSDVRDTFFSFLQALDLRPQDWERLVDVTGGTSPTIIDVVRRAPEIAQAIVVLMTPDDTVQLQPDLAGDRDPAHETATGCQPRPNVFLELGMALMAYPERTIVIEIGSLRLAGDLAGLNVIRFDGSGRAIEKVVSRLRLAGCPVDDRDTSWKDPARFAGLAALTRAPHEFG